MILDYVKKGILLVIADILSLITIVLCLLQKLPQIKYIYGYKSARGISTTSLYLELFSYSAMMMYNYCYEYSLLSYLEYPILLIQQYIMIALVLKYKRLYNQNTAICAGAYFATILLFGYRFVPKFLLAMLVPLCTPISASSKIVQLFEILRTKDSTTISLLTWSISAFTNLTRIYTVSVESHDSMLLANFTISCALSSAVLATAYYYKRDRPKLFWEQKSVKTYIKEVKIPKVATN